MPILGLGRKKSVEEAASTAPAASITPAWRRLAPVRKLEDHGDPVLASLLGVAAARDWPSLRAALAPYDGHDLSSLISDVCEKTEHIGEWVPRDESDALARTVLGSALIRQGWRVRTAASASHVSQAQFKEFHRLLAVAEDHLYAAVELDPASAAPWYFLVITSRGLEVELDVRWRRFDALTARAPGHLGGHRQMLQNLCEKWSGSHQQMHEFATAAMRGEHGGQLAELVPDAHLEHWLRLGDKQGGREYLQQPQVREELQEAAELTIFRPGYTASPRSPYWAANLFAMAFALSGLWRPSMRAFELTDGVVEARWNYLNGNHPEAMYTNWRNHVRQLQKASS